eukprot:TRINITY_DN260_c0_g1_i1.p1 TRINITY_DN260_c0_g1~~TRINITY_DN260_c0_g1_i1.p1  ORF type:complete len:159 (+),score=50.43 TRINITY_DN260_c0_g1_i1:21-497(+)
MDPDTKETLDSFTEQIDVLEVALQPLLTSDLKQLNKDLPPLEAARLNVTSTYILNSLFFMLLKVQGVDTADHPIKAELEKVKTYMQKIKEVEEKDKKPTLVVDKSAADRLLRHGLGVHKRREPSASDDESEKKNVETPKKEKKKSKEGKEKKKKKQKK